MCSRRPTFTAITRSPTGASSGCNEPMAAKYDDDSWLELQRRREERMRYEILSMLHRATGGDTEREINCWGFATDLGVWHAEVFRVLEYLDRRGLLEYRGAGPVVRLTQAGRDLIEGGSAGRQSIRD